MSVHTDVESVTDLSSCLRDAYASGAFAGMLCTMFVEIVAIVGIHWMRQREQRAFQAGQVAGLGDFRDRHNQTTAPGDRGVGGFRRTP